MIKILQFGEGNFLRTFADHYFETLNKEGGDYGVYIVKPINHGSLENFRKQNNKYHIVLRGVKNKEVVEDVYKINCVKEVIDPFSEQEKYMALATDPELKILVSNTTEAGICFNGGDDINGFDGITYPAKLTKFLLKRFDAGLDGLYLMPVELIDNNADELIRCVNEYIKLWNLPKDFSDWVNEKNYFCNTLVDRIVSGHPKDEATQKHLTELIGEEDALVSVGEPFGLWAVENKGQIGQYIKDGVHGIEVVLTDNIKYYKKRKVRVLNGSHTNLVHAGMWYGKETVYDCMKDETFLNFVNETLKEEIIPFVSDDIAATTAFASSVTERFLNPYLNHQLVSISLNSISKWRARNLPSFKDYYAKYGKIPENMTKGLSYLLATYKALFKGDDGKYYAAFPNKNTEIKDDLPYLIYFTEGGSVVDFLKDVSVWGEDLTAYEGLAEKVNANVEAIVSGNCKLIK